MVEYILRVYDVDMEDLKSALRRDGQREMEALMGTIADTLIKQGHEDGIAEGRADTLRKLLERRFGPLPQEARARIDAASLAELDRWLNARDNVA